MSRCINNSIKIVIGLVIHGSIVNAEIVTDGTVGSAGAISGPAYNISATLGQQSGTNLLHSFSSFNIATGESANFSGPASIQNIISRVTGNTLSSIDGAINSSVNGANLWLINPNGIIFGDNASLNVSGSFHASTADYVLLDDGSHYQVGQNSNLNLLTANPVGFGFLSQTPAHLAVNNADLSVAPGQTLSFVGGAVDFDGASLQASDGRINVASLGSPGEVSFTTPANKADSGINVSNNTTVSSITLVDTTLDVSGDGGGDIYIVGGEFFLDPTSTISNDTVNTDGGVIHITGTDIVLNEGIVSATTNGAGAGADIFFQGNNLTVNNNTSPPTFTGLVTRVNTNGLADSGNIFIDMTDTVSVEREGVIRSQGRGNSKGGDININAANLQVISGGKIFTDTTFNGGSSGNININTSNSVRVSGSNSKVDTQTYGDSTATSVSLNITTSDLIIDDHGEVSSDSFNAGFGAGIHITADNLSMSNEAVINARTFDNTGLGITINLQDNLIITSGASISTDTFNIGQGSDINISATNASIVDGGFISASTKRDGKAGNIYLSLTGTLTIDGQGNSQTGLFSVSGDTDPFFQQTPPFSGERRQH